MLSGRPNGRRSLSSRSSRSLPVAVTLAVRAVAAIPPVFPAALAATLAARAGFRAAVLPAALPRSLVPGDDVGPSLDFFGGHLRTSHLGAGRLFDGAIGGGFDGYSFLRPIAD
jgi:hypothetical protein